ncbi:TIGR03435 family protein [Robertkochia flava]|uniref:TIGR03435 family protein n=1 Tax=Robertkochia flava TaxID=3447986 RepID=UPI001CCE06FB|nr:TIGR03435 family protein [Robertkochia marina]
MKRTLYLILLTLTVVSCSADLHPVKVGQRVPDFSFDKVIGDQITSLKLDDLRGKTVVIDYWATWFRPCIPALRKLDSLKGVYGDDLAVIAVSEENTDRLQRFMDRTNWDITYVSDSLSKKMFPYRVIPHSVILDANGVVKAITHPSNIDAELIGKVISGAEVAPELKDDFYVDPEVTSTLLKQELKKGYSISLHSYKQQQRGGYRYHRDQGEINGVSLWNSTIPRMYQTIFEVESPNRIVFEEGLSFEDFPYEPDHQFNLELYTAPEYHDQWKELGVAFLNDYFDVNGKMTTDTLEVYELVQTRAILIPSDADRTGVTFTGSHFEGKAIPMHKFTGYLEGFLDKPVTDQTGLGGKYDIQIDWAFEEQGSLQKALDALGLKLQVSENAVPVEVIKIYKKAI